MDRYRFSEQEQAFMESMEVPFAVFQLVDQRIVTLAVSNGFCELLGTHDREKVYAAMDHDTYRNIHPDDAARVGNAVFRFMRDGGRFESVYRLKNPDGSGFLVIHAYGQHVYTPTGVRLAQIWYADEGTYSEGKAQDGTALSETLSNAIHEESILRASYFDYLTGLPSMTYFFELAEAGKKAIRAKGENPVLMYMDFSGMKFYNTRHGFAEGDKLLRAFARILIKIFGMERCCRIGADHFAVQAEEAGLDDKLKAMFEACKTMNDGKTLPVHVGVYPGQPEVVHTSVACDRAKLACSALRGRYGIAVNTYSQDLNDDAEKKQYVIENLDRALEEKWIKVYFQAIVRAANGQVCDEEALSRWIDPVRGFLSPADFIPALEDARLIYKLDLYVVEQVLEKMKWQAGAGLFVVPQSINLSRWDFESCDIVEEIRRRVDDAGIERSMLTIEITESVIGGNFDFMKAQIERFQALGFRVWMDDFGSGYSSLDVLQSIRFDLIKFDMRFMQQFDKGDESKIILMELTKMASGLGVETVCEGVETQEELDFLREIGCTKIQGYYYGKPKSLEELFERAKSGAVIPFENPEESEYYSAIGRINLYDMAVLVNDDDESLRRFFDTLPTAIIEVNGTRAKYTRTNRAYRDFMERTFGLYALKNETDYAEMPDVAGSSFMGAVMRCSRDGVRAIVDERVGGATVHSMIRRIAVNPVTGAAAMAVAVLAVVQDSEEPNMTYAHIARALSTDYLYLFYVNLQTGKYIEYTPDAVHEDLAVERRGDDFFTAARLDATEHMYAEDRDDLIRSFNKENVVRSLDEHGAYTQNYRLLIDGKPTYVSMKAVRMQGDRDNIIIGVNNVDAQMRQKEALMRIQMEQASFKRINALSQDTICIYTVDPDTGAYTEYSATRDYAGLGLAKSGDDFFAQARRESARHVYAQDIEKFNTLLTRERVLEEIERNGLFSMQYRMILDGAPTYVGIKAARVEEKGGPQLIIGVYNVDTQVRREQDYERKLAAARSRANLDTLTGVKNRTAYDNMSESLTRQIEGGQSVRYAIALCRVSDLERVNEHEGQEAGDRLIRDACAEICEIFKHSPVFRVAGDQFAVIAQGHDYDAIDALVAELEANNRKARETGGVVIACGMAKYDGTGSVGAVFEKADALCRAE